MDNRSAIRRVIKVIILLCIVAIVAVIGWIVTTRGFLVIQGEAGTYYLQQGSGSTIQSIKSTGGRILVSSGTYNVTFRGSDNAVSVTTVTVPNLLQTATTSLPSITPKQVTRAGIATLDSIITIQDGQVISLSSTQPVDTIMVSRPNDPTGLQANMIPLSASLLKPMVTLNQLVGFTTDDSEAVRIIPIIYDFSSTIIPKKQVVGKSYPSVDTLALLPSQQTNSKRFGVYSNQGGGGSLDIFEGTKLISTIDNLAVAAGADKTPVVSFSQTMAAFGSGDDYAGTAADFVRPDTAALPKSTKDYIVTLISLDTKKPFRTIKLGKTNAIASLQLSADSTYLSVVKNGGEILVYDTKSSQLVFYQTMPNIMTPVWTPDNQLIFGSAENGLFNVDMKSKNLTTLFSSDKMTFRSFTSTPDRILFTASTAGAASPDSYVLEPNQTATTNDLVRALPYQNSTLKLRALNQTIYAAENDLPVSRRNAAGDFLLPGFYASETVDSGLQAQTVDYLQKNVKDYQRYKIIYGDGL